MGNEVSAPASTAELQPGERPDTPTVSRPVMDGQIKPSALVIVGPSGVGKGTLINKLMQGSGQFGFSTSHTTRQPRPGEKHGEHYFFTTKEKFCAEIAEGKFLEYAEVHGRLYGTSRSAVQQVLDEGRVCILDVDVQGARALRASGIKAIFVFVAPPSLEDLARRLAGRGTETAEQIHIRMSNAKGEINTLNEKGLYDYLIINDNLEEASAKLKQIAARAAGGIDPEPGQVPESVIIEEAPLPDLAELMQIQQQEHSIPAVKENAAQASTVVATQETAPQQQQSVASTNHDASPGGMSTLPEAPMSAALALPSPAGMEKWVGKVALVTGASSGIGRAVCEALAVAGMRVVAVARRKDRLEELQQRMHQELGVSPASFLPVVCDITKDAEVATLPKIVGKRWEDSGIDVLVNNAGMSRNDASLFEGNVASWVEMLSTNVLGTCMCTRAVLQDMVRRGSYGHVINMVGLSGHRIPDGPQGGGFYCGTKAAVKTITEGLRQEARGRGVPLRVSAISPGIVETEFFAVRAFGDSSAIKSATSQFKCLDPADIAQAMLWCLSAPDHVEVNDVVVRPTSQLL